MQICFVGVYKHESDNIIVLISRYKWIHDWNRGHTQAHWLIPSDSDDVNKGQNLLKNIYMDTGNKMHCL